MTRKPDDKPELEELLGDLCNEALDAEDRKRLNDALVDDREAQKFYLMYADLHAAVRQYAQSLDDQEFVVREAQAAIDSQHQAFDERTLASNPSATSGRSDAKAITSESYRRYSESFWQTFLSPLGRRPPLRFTIAALFLVSVGLLLLYPPDRVGRDLSQNSLPDVSDPTGQELGPAHLSGAVGARWAGDKLELIEGTQFAAGQRLELVEGLAEVCFLGGARVILQGPAILEIQDENHATVPVGRVAATVPDTATRFTLRTAMATIASASAEYGVEVDVDESLVAQVYAGLIDLKLNDDDFPTPHVELAEDQGLQIDAASGRLKQLDQANRLHFVRYLPQHEVFVNLADIVAGGNGLGEGSGNGYHQGISLQDGTPVNDYGAPIQGDGQYHKAQDFDFIDGVFIPDGKRGAIQVDSIGRTFVGFPPTAGDCWGGAIMARRPAQERSLPFMRLEFHGDNYGYVNWLHIASHPEELSPEGFGIVGMHSNCGVTFDLHAIRACHPNKRIVRFRALVGNLEAKQEAYVADAWVLVDGQLRYSRKAFSREQGAEEIDVPLTDHDRFLVLAVTDSGENTAYDWVGFGDPVIETTTALGRVASGSTLIGRKSQADLRSRAKSDSAVDRQKVTESKVPWPGAQRLMRTMATNVRNLFLVTVTCQAHDASQSWPFCDASESDMDRLNGIDWRNSIGMMPFFSTP